MADTTDFRRGALHDAPISTGGDAIRRTCPDFQGVLNLRCRPADADTVAAVEKAVGVSLPLEPNRTNEAQAHGRVVLWLGPDEWLVVTRDGEAAALERAIRERAGGDPWLSVTDLSHDYTALVLKGDAARDVLAKGCPLDLHPRSFRAGDCAQTVLAGTRVLIRARTDGAFELWVRNSFARYTDAWLRDAMTEFR